MSRRCVVPVLFAAMLVAGGARADCRGPVCALTLGIGRLDPGIAKLVAAAGFTTLATAGAAVQLHHLYDRADPDGVYVFTDGEGRSRMALALVPTPPPVPLAGPSDERREVPSGVFRFNDTATTVLLTAGGAALLGSMIAGIVSGVRHK